ncbi:MAG: hypothetical protein WCV00_22130 [Verrucomicrobiia bacterium]|jgi:hypothetical protein
MKAFIRSHKKLTAAIGVAVFLPVWWLSAPVRGYIVARFDVARGHYEVQTCGLPAKWRPDYARLLRERYDIKLRSVASCIVSHSLGSYVRGYNAASIPAAKHKFGHDVFAECEADARKAWTEKKNAGTKIR